MNVSSRTPEGLPNRCPVCGSEIRLDPSHPPGDAPCPVCGSLVWFEEGQTWKFCPGWLTKLAVVIVISALELAILLAMGAVIGAIVLVAFLFGGIEAAFLVNLAFLLFGGKLSAYPARWLGNLSVKIKYSGLKNGKA